MGLIMVSAARINDYLLNLQLHMIPYTLVLILINAHCVVDESVHWKLLSTYFLKNTSHTYLLLGYSSLFKNTLRCIWATISGN